MKLINIAPIIIVSFFFTLSTKGQDIQKISSAVSQQKNYFSFSQSLKKLSGELESHSYYWKFWFSFNYLRNYQNKWLWKR